MPHRQVDARHAEGQTNQDRNYHPDVKLTAHAKEIVIGIQPQKHPVGMLVGRILPVEQQWADHSINVPAAAPDALHQREIPVPRLPKGKAVLVQKAVQGALAHQRPVLPVVPEGQKVAGFLLLVQLGHGEVITNLTAGNLYAQHAINPPLTAQRNGIGNHLIPRVLLQGERKGPAAQILCIGLRVLLTGLPGVEKEVI